MIRIIACSIYLVVLYVPLLNAGSVPSSGNSGNPDSNIRSLIRPDGVIAEQNDLSGNNSAVRQVYNTPDKSFYVSFDTWFNTKDFLLGGSAGYKFFEQINLYPNLYFLGRPYKKTIFEEKEPNVYYQYKERRFITGLALDFMVSPLERLGFYFNGGLGYTFGYYTGTTKWSESKLVPVISAGVMLKFKYIYLRGGYQYCDIPSIPYNRLYAGVMLIL